MFLRLRLKPMEEERDAYIQTYKVGKKKQELDEFVAKNIRRFSLTGIVWKIMLQIKITDVYYISDELMLFSILLSNYKQRKNVFCDIQE